MEISLCLKKKGNIWNNSSGRSQTDFAARWMPMSSAITPLPSSSTNTSPRGSTCPTVRSRFGVILQVWEGSVLCFGCGIRFVHVSVRAPLAAPDRAAAGFFRNRAGGETVMTENIWPAGRRSGSHSACRPRCGRCSSGWKRGDKNAGVPIWHVTYLRHDDAP